MKKRWAVATSVVVAVLVTPIAGLALRNYFVARATFDELKTFATRDLNDPESARFRDLRLYYLMGGGIWENVLELPHLKTYSFGLLTNMFLYQPNQLELCGEMNAKNAFGAYVGYKPFLVASVLREEKRRSVFVDMRPTDDFAKDMCSKVLGLRKPILAEP